MQASVGETSTTTDVSRIEVEFQKIIDTIKEQEIVAIGQENANGMLKLMLKLMEVTYLPYYN
jgi:hypothetical protein